MTRSCFCRKVFQQTFFSILLGLVLSNRCNLGCIHCYQAKNGDRLLTPAGIGLELRRELAGFYPYLSMLDLLGGEVFLSPGFEELVDDVAAMVKRPILRITTNGTCSTRHGRNGSCVRLSTR